jgi:hypothetical protein
MQPGSTDIENSYADCCNGTHSLGGNQLRERHVTFGPRQSSEVASRSQYWGVRIECARFLGSTMFLRLFARTIVGVGRTMNSVPVGRTRTTLRKNVHMVRRSHYPELTDCPSNRWPCVRCDLPGGGQGKVPHNVEQKRSQA